jgi:hypothetical protein
MSAHMLLQCTCLLLIQSGHRGRSLSNLWLCPTSSPRIPISGVVAPAMSLHFTPVCTENLNPDVMVMKPA